MRLSEALDEAAAGGGLGMGWSLEEGHYATAPSGCSPEAAEDVDKWATILAAWWRTSPSAILECPTCGEIAFVGSKKTRKCWRKCETKMSAIEPTFTKKRPRRKKIKLEDQ